MVPLSHSQLLAVRLIQVAWTGIWSTDWLNGLGLTSDSKRLLCLIFLESRGSHAHFKAQKWLTGLVFSCFHRDMSDSHTFLDCWAGVLVCLQRCLHVFSKEVWMNGCFSYIFAWFFKHSNSFQVWQLCLCWLEWIFWVRWSILDDLHLTA